MPETNSIKNHWFIFLAHVALGPIIFAPMCFADINNQFDELRSALVTTEYSAAVLQSLFLAIPMGFDILLSTSEFLSSAKVSREWISRIFYVASFSAPKYVMYNSFINPVQVKHYTHHNRVVQLYLCSMCLSQVNGLFYALEVINIRQSQIPCFRYPGKLLVALALTYTFGHLFILYSHFISVSFSTILCIMGITLVFSGHILFVALFRMCVMIVHRNFVLNRPRLSADDMMILGILFSFLTSSIIILIIGVWYHGFDLYHKSAHSLIVSAMTYAQSFHIIMLTVLPGRIANLQFWQMKRCLNKYTKFVQRISDDIRSSINTLVLGIACVDAATRDLLRVSNDKSRAHALLDTVKDIRESSGAAVLIMDEFQAFENMNGGKLSVDLEEAHPTDIIVSTIRSFKLSALDKGVMLKLVMEDTAGWMEQSVIRIDKNKFAQVLRNLLSNAIKFTPGGGTVVVCVTALSTDSCAEASAGRRSIARQLSSVSSSTTSSSSPSSLTSSSSSLRVGATSVKGAESQFVALSVVTAASMQCLRIRVIDSGAGISKDNLRKLFGQYVQFDAAKLQKGKGSGLGLWISKGIVKLHGGSIHAESEGEGAGCTFVIELPLLCKFTQRESDVPTGASLHFSSPAACIPSTPSTASLAVASKVSVSASVIGGGGGGDEVGTRRSVVVQVPRVQHAVQRMVRIARPGHSLGMGPVYESISPNNVEFDRSVSPSLCSGHSFNMSFDLGIIDNNAETGSETGNSMDFDSTSNYQSLALASENHNVATPTHTPPRCSRADLNDPLTSPTALTACLPSRTMSHRTAFTNPDPAVRIPTTPPRTKLTNPDPAVRIPTTPPRTILTNPDPAVRIPTTPPRTTLTPDRSGTFTQPRSTTVQLVLRNWKRGSVSISPNTRATNKYDHVDNAATGGAETGLFQDWTSISPVAPNAKTEADVGLRLGPREYVQSMLSANTPSKSGGLRATTTQPILSISASSTSSSAPPTQLPSTLTQLQRYMLPRPFPSTAMPATMMKTTTVASHDLPTMTSTVPPMGTARPVSSWQPSLSAAFSQRPLIPASLLLSPSEITQSHNMLHERKNKVGSESEKPPTTPSNTSAHFPGKEHCQHALYRSPCPEITQTSMLPLQQRHLLTNHLESGPYEEPTKLRQPTCGRRLNVRDSYHVEPAPVVPYHPRYASTTPAIFSDTVTEYSTETTGQKPLPCNTSSTLFRNSTVDELSITSLNLNFSSPTPTDFHDFQKVHDDEDVDTLTSEAVTSTFVAQGMKSAPGALTADGKWDDGLRFLLVDGSSVSRRIVKRLLLCHGHQVKEVVDALSFVRLIESQQRFIHTHKKRVVHPAAVAAAAAFSSDSVGLNSDLFSLDPKFDIAVSSPRHHTNMVTDPAACNAIGMSSDDDVFNNSKECGLRVQNEQETYATDVECASVFDVVLIDYSSLQDNGGPDAVRWLRSTGYAGMIFGLTGSTQQSRVHKMLSQGLNRVLLKPLRLQALKIAVGQCCDELDM